MGGLFKSRSRVFGVVVAGAATVAGTGGALIASAGAIVPAPVNDYVRSVTYQTAVSGTVGTVQSGAYTKGVTVKCPQGLEPIGGGASISRTVPGSYALIASKPLPIIGMPSEGGNASGWAALATGPNNTTWRVDAYVICADINGTAPVPTDTTTTTATTIPPA